MSLAERRPTPSPPHAAAARRAGRRRPPHPDPERRDARARRPDRPLRRRLVPRGRHGRRAGHDARHGHRRRRAPGDRRGGSRHAASTASSRAAGGPAEPIAALLVGGYSGTWLAGRCRRRGVQPRRARGVRRRAPGAGILIALPQAACGLLETARLMRWFAAESAGQCGPCVRALRHGPDDGGDRGRPLERGRRRAAAPLGGEIERRGACRHPDGAVHLARSALDVFAADLAGTSRATRAWPPAAPAAGRPRDRRRVEVSA